APPHLPPHPERHARPGRAPRGLDHICHGYRPHRGGPGMRVLKVQVERAVRPVRASERRKDRMREELYTHLLKTYEEELARLDDEQAAVEQAIRRFGEPAEITQALQSSVPRIERFLFVRCAQAFEDHFRRKEGESVVRPAARLAVYL